MQLSARMLVLMPARLSPPSPLKVIPTPAAESISSTTIECCADLLPAAGI
jgi:hypothetical protein